MSDKAEQESWADARRESPDAASGPPAHVEDPYYRSFLDRDVEGALLATPTGEILDASEVACRVLGRTREELIGVNAESLFAPPDPRSADAWENQRRNGYFRGRLHVVRRAGGAEELFEVPVALVRYRNKAGLDRLVVVLRDPAEQQRAAEPPRGSEEWFFSIARYTADVVQVLNADGSIRYTSPATEWVSGYTPEEVIGTVAAEVIHPDDLERVVAEFAEIWSKPGLSGVVRHRARHKFGHWLHLETTANNLLDDPEVQGVVLTIRDVTETVRAAEEIGHLKRNLERRVEERTRQLRTTMEEAEDSESMLRESLDMFRTTFEQAAVGLAHLDLDGRWLRVNEKLLELVGYSREELLRRTLLDITHPDDREEAVDRMRRLRSGEMEGYSVHNRYVKKGGSQVWASLGVSLVRHPSGEPAYLIAVVEDIDERKRAELTLRSFTPRELEVLGLLARGLTNRQIARALHISVNTAKFHVQHVVEKLGVADRTQAAYRAAELDLVDRDKH